jgi:hypothetical protein
MLFTTLREIEGAALFSSGQQVRKATIARRNTMRA